MRPYIIVVSIYSDVILSICVWVCVYESAGGCCTVLAGNCNCCRIVSGLSWGLSWAAIVINGDGVIECDLALNMHDHVDERLSWCHSWMIDYIQNHWMTLDMRDTCHNKDASSSSSCSHSRRVTNETMHGFVSGMSGNNGLMIQMTCLT